MNVAILSIGTELTRGELVNTNAQWLAEQLTGLGFEVVEHSAVADDLKVIEHALKRLASGAGVVIVTGGLGPTTDDLTAQAAAATAGVALVRNQAAVEAITERFKRYRRPMPHSNLKQADFPEGAEMLPNAQGTAPGFALKVGDARCFFLPGVPVEMKHLFETHVSPRIAGLTEQNSYQLHMRTFGLTESKIADLLADLEESLGAESARGTRTIIGYRATFPEIEIKVWTRAADKRQAEREANRVADQIYERLGEAVFGGREDSFAAYVGRVLKKSRRRLAIAESCTGGLVGKLVTDVAGSSEYFVLDAVVYSNQAKTALLGVSEQLLAEYGAVSPEAVTAMAEGALRVSGADIALAISGIAGPDGGSEDKPVGAVWFGLAKKGEETVARELHFPGDRYRVRTLSAYNGLKMVADAILGEREHLE
jgi:nicotinamide-nucleotide amidase